MSRPNIRSPTQSLATVCTSNNLFSLFLPANDIFNRLEFGLHSLYINCFMHIKRFILHVPARPELDFIYAFQLNVNL